LKAHIHQITYCNYGSINPVEGAVTRTTRCHGNPHCSPNYSTLVLKGKTAKSKLGVDLLVLSNAVFSFVGRCYQALVQGSCCELGFLELQIKGLNVLQVFKYFLAIFF